MRAMGSTDPAPLSGWFDRYGVTLALYARQWLNAESAEDVVQEVFIRLLSQRRAPGNVKGWLFRSVRNAAINRARSEHRRRSHERRHGADHPAWFQTCPDDPIDAKIADSMLLSLPVEQRETIVLRIWAGMTLVEISRVTGHPVPTLFSRYRAGLAALRRAMEKSCKT